jgi:hypothetical protein
VPITGKTGLRSGTDRLTALTINYIAIPSSVRKITPGIFEYLPEISKMYDRITTMHRTRII